MVATQILVMILHIKPETVRLQKHCIITIHTIFYSPAMVLIIYSFTNEFGVQFHLMMQKQAEHPGERYSRYMPYWYA